MVHVKKVLDRVMKTLHIRNRHLFNPEGCKFCKLLVNAQCTHPLANFPQSYRPIGQIPTPIESTDESMLRKYQSLSHENICLLLQSYFNPKEQKNDENKFINKVSSELINNVR